MFLIAVRFRRSVGRDGHVWRSLRLILPFCRHPRLTNVRSYYAGEEERRPVSNAEAQEEVVALLWTIM